jgi:NADPH:quinone reductase-like Zn-dependent oxidoreductase
MVIPSASTANGARFVIGDWPTGLKNVLGESLLDSVIDSAGGPIAQQVGRVLRPGGRIVLYGMTAAPQAPFTMREVLRNQQLIGQKNFPSPSRLRL